MKSQPGDVSIQYPLTSRDRLDRVSEVDLIVPCVSGWDGGVNDNCCPPWRVLDDDPPSVSRLLYVGQEKRKIKEGGE